MAPGLAVDRSRPDLCPGVLRPWPAADGALVRLRLVGGQVTARQLTALAEVSAAYGDGDVHLTGRANLQVRGLPSHRGALPAEVVDAVAATGLLPSRTHELVRNVMVSPLTGRYAGRADLRPLARELDRALCADEALAILPGRFLVVLDDGRGDLVGRPLDLGLVAVDAASAQVRWGRAWGPVVRLADAPAILLAAAHAFLARRGTGPSAAWHVDELDGPLGAGEPRDPRTEVASPPLAYGVGPGGDHVEVPDGRLDRALLARLAGLAGLAGLAAELVVTPWRGLLLPVGAR